MLKIPAKLVASSTPTTQSKFLLKQFFLRRNRGKHRGERGFKELIPVGWGHCWTFSKGAFPWHVCTQKLIRTLPLPGIN